VVKNVKNPCENTKKRGKIRVILLVCLDEKRRRSICGLLLFGVSKKC